MKAWKTVLLAVVTLCVAALGAAMPLLTSRVQDARTENLWKEEKLSAVALTLRREDDVAPVLELMGKKCTESLWTGKTVLEKEDASEAALAALRAMDSFDLLPAGETERLEQAERTAEPHLLVAEDGSSALLWMCTWEDVSETFITVDDATGKAVRIMVRNSLDYEGSVTEDFLMGKPSRLERWSSFLQDYYGLQLKKLQQVSPEETDSPAASFLLHFSAGEENFLVLSLELSECTLFNYW